MHKNIILILMIFTTTLTHPAAYEGPVKKPAQKPARELAQQDPSAQRANSRLARLTGHLGKPGDASAQAQSAASFQDPSAQRAHSRLGRLTGHLGKPQEASAQVNPSSASGMMARGENLKNILGKSSFISVGKLPWQEFLLEHSDMLRTIFEHEEYYLKDYYVLYHAHAAGYRLVHYILGLIYQNLIAKRALPDDFICLRSTLDRGPYKNVQEYLDSFDLAGKGWNFGDKADVLHDHRPDIAKDILSANAVLFGNYDRYGECTWDYFLSNNSMSEEYIQKTLAHLFSHYGLKQEIIPQLLLLVEQYKTLTGDLIQFFIHKPIIDTVAYVSRGWGIPLDQPLDIGVSQATAKSFEHGFIAHKERYQTCAILLSALQRREDMYIPGNFKWLQMRLFFAANGPLMNPFLVDKKGKRLVYMYRFTTLPQQKLEKYYGAIDHLMEQAGLKIQFNTHQKIKPILLTDSIEKAVQEDLQRLMRKPKTFLEAIQFQDSAKWIHTLITTKTGGDINQTDRFGNTPLILACRENDLAVAKLLISHKPDVNAKNNHGTTALMYSCAIGDIDLTKLLLAHQAKANIQDNTGATALMMACTKERMEIAELLLAHHANINIKSNTGLTALMFSCSRTNVDIVRLLLHKGADTSSRDDEGQTALDIAKKHGNKAIIKLLENTIAEAQEIAPQSRIATPTNAKRLTAEQRTQQIVQADDIRSNL